MKEKEDNTPHVCKKPLRLQSWAAKAEVISKSQAECGTASSEWQGMLSAGFATAECSCLLQLFQVHSTH